MQPFPRTRKRDERAVMPYQRVTTDSTVIPTSVSQAQFNSAPYGMSEVMTDIVTPGFAAIQAQGGIVNTPMSRRSELTEYTGTLATFLAISPPSAVGNYTIQDTGQYGGLLDYYVPAASLKGHATELIDLVKHQKLAAIQARNNVSKIHVQSLVSLAELPKTIQLLTNTVKTVTKVVRGVKTGNLTMVTEAIGGRKAKGQSNTDWIHKTASQRWLEYRYGWTPLVMEVQGALKALDKTRKLKTRATARGKSEESRNSQSSYNFDTGQSGIETFAFNAKEKLGVRAYCLYTADLDFQSARDFGVSEFPLAFWELVPFSFVIDWFVNIGDWLEAITPKLGIKILAEGVSTTYERSVSRTLSGYAPAVPHPTDLRFIVSGHSIDDLWQEKMVTRTPGLGVLLASPPPINVKINVKRTLDAIALLKALGGNKSIRT